ncbi:LamG-like jellyroll fold domain-containing protein [Mangrovimonas sp. YM274]|uniref:LamG-like jellyroll fold domain-containing protein n=1 Tax=Mangrovimonas sp. YM274 TaxID=3070660 RepID=UPI0027DD9865|nr:LamG-like jellyroll fold domain-containing protein [Mangrovimonas sp. YM274]WMI70230.1 LamG-like jellyroll fold domain-containing protein [Mangrovimonas sp. YM274]
MMKQLHKKLVLSALAAGSFLISNAQTGINFDGVDDHIQTTVLPVTATNPRTVEVWIRTTKNSIPTNQGGDGQSVICDWGKDNTGNRFTFNILGNNALRIEVGGGGVNATTAVNDGLWHHVAVVFESFASTNHSVKFYVDGNLDAEGILDKYAYILSTGTNLKIGEKITGDKNFEGDMDEFRIWNRVLTQEELQSRMYRELCGDEEGLVVYYPFSVGTPNGDNTVINEAINEADMEDIGTLNDFALTGTSSNWVTGRPLVALEENTLSAMQEGVSYQWVNCNNASEAVSGATEQSFTPEVSGTYAVEMTVETAEGTCVTTSECMEVEVTSLSVEDNVLEGLRIFPNPTSNNINVDLNEVYETVEAQLVAITGKVVGEYQFNNTNGFDIALDQLNSGVYFLNLKVDQSETVTIKVVKM